MPTLSIISTVYNGAQYLEDYFFSIASQTLTDYELILIDDGSTDESGLICDKHANTDSRIHVVHQENQGLAEARNIALNLVSTEWITFVDCDDTIHPCYLEILYRGIKENNVMLSGVGVLKTESIPRKSTYEVFADWKKYVVDEAFLLDKLAGDSFGQIACAKLINVQFLQKYPFTKGRVFEDNAVVKKWLYEAGTIAYDNNKLYFYRMNIEGLSAGSFNNKKVEDVLWSRDEIIDFYKEKGLHEAYIQAEINYILFAINLYFKLKKTDEKNAKILKKRILDRYKTDRAFVNFSRENKRFVNELKHPRLMWIYWRIKAIM